MGRIEARRGGKALSHPTNGRLLIPLTDRSTLTQAPEKITFRREGAGSPKKKNLSALGKQEVKRTGKAERPLKGCSSFPNLPWGL